MGPIESKVTIRKSYEQLYLLSQEIYIAEHEIQKQLDMEQFKQLFEGFREVAVDYEWGQAIPFYCYRYFYKILPSLRKAEIQNMYKALNATIFSSRRSEINSDYQNSFYNNLDNRLEIEQEKISNSLTASTMLNQSILFEQDVVNIYNDEPRANINPLFRTSILNYEQFQSFKSSKSQNNGVVIKQAVLISKMPKKVQKQLSFLIQFYKRFSMVIQSLMNSASFVSLPLRHFELQMKQKKEKKKLKIHKENKKHKYQWKVVQQTKQGQESRRIQKFNQHLLLEEISTFTAVYTDFIWEFFNLTKINQAHYSKLITYENIYNLMTSVVWSKVWWVGERGWEYQQLLLQNYIIYQGPSKVGKWLPDHIMDLVLDLPKTPIKYLKQVVELYRQISCLQKQMTPDDLMMHYNSLYYEMAKRNKIKGVLRMIQIVNELWKGEKFGQVGYAWTTWQAGLEILGIEAKKFQLSDFQKH